MRSASILTLTLAATAVAWGRSDGEAGLAEARRAIQQLRYEDAKPLLDAALERGHHGRAELIDLYELRGVVASVVEGPDAGESEFRRMLVLAPDHAPPPRDTPVFMVPFTRARRWVNAHGGLEVQARLGAPPAAALPTPLVLTIVSDPFTQVAADRLFVRRRGEDTFVAAATTIDRTLRPRLPAVAAGGALDYYLELLDRGDNVLGEVGSARAPLHVEVAPAVAAQPPPPPSSSPSLVTTAPARAPLSHVVARWTLGGVGLLALGAAIGTDVASRQDYDQLLRDCAPDCAQAPNYDRFNAERSAALALYPIAAVTLATSVALFIYDGVRYRGR
jgi:hypothetical protein